MSALDRKLLRDLWHVKGQALAIALVIGCGVATFVMSLSTLESLETTRDTYYERYRFAHIFAHLKRAPETLAARLAEIPGVAQVQTRIVVDVTLDVANLPEPGVGRLVSIPDRQTLGLNDIYLRRGRYIDPTRSGEVLVGELFARAHELQPGDEITAVINGKMQQLTIVGIALSPEYVLQIQAGQLLPDEKRFGVFWMGRTQLAAAFDMDGAFNDLTMATMRGAVEDEVIRRVDQLTEPYGGVGAYGRDEQVSHRYLSDEIRQLGGMARVAPTIFLAVAAFLLNVVLSRLVRTQREQIAALKAFGYSKPEIAWHYLKLVLMVVATGCVLGVVTGGWMGHNLTQMYTRFYKFPIFQYQLDLFIVCGAVLVSVAAAVVGTQASVRAAAALPPAEAMRPEPPAKYRRTLLERTGLGILLSPAGRMIIRNLERRPWKAALSSLGIAMSVAVLVVGSFMEDALDYIIRFQFTLSQRQDMMVTFVEPTTSGVRREVNQLPGVVNSEFFRSVPTRLRFGHRSRRVGVMGLEANCQLFRLIDDQEVAVDMPADGLMLSTKLAELLGADYDDVITLELLEGNRGTHRVPVTAMVTEFGGTNAYMDARALHRLIREDSHVSGAFLQVDQSESLALYARLKQTPQVASVNVRTAALQSFRDTIAENLNRMRTFNVIFASVIAVGVVYNSARISLAERSWELATLRVIGFTRGEISAILLGELALLTLVALPVGMLIGYAMAAWATLGLDTEIYRIPLVIDRSTYAFAALVVLIAALASGLSVRRQLNELDLVAVLKTKE